MASMKKKSQNPVEDVDLALVETEPHEVHTISSDSDDETDVENDDKSNKGSSGNENEEGNSENEESGSEESGNENENGAKNDGGAAEDASSDDEDANDEEKEEKGEDKPAKVKEEKDGGKPTKVKEEKRERFSGAARKRLSRLLKEGVPYKTAVSVIKNQLASNKKGTEEQSSKRTTSETEGKEDAAPKKIKLESDDMKTLTTPVAVGIIHPEFPRKLIDNTQLHTLRQFIMNAIEDIPDDGPEIRFEGCWVRSGWLEVNCSNGATCCWLKNLITNLQPWEPWEDAKLKVVLGAQIPRPHLCSVYIPDDTPGVKLAEEKVLTRLRKMNRGLRTQDWAVLSVVQYGPGHNWTFTVDEASLLVLEENKYKAYFGFGQIEFKPRVPKFNKTGAAKNAASPAAGSGGNQVTLLSANNTPSPAAGSGGYQRPSPINSANNEGTAAEGSGGYQTIPKRITVTPRLDMPTAKLRLQALPSDQKIQRQVQHLTGPQSQHVSSKPPASSVPPKRTDLNLAASISNPSVLNQRPLSFQRYNPVSSSFAQNRSAINPSTVGPLQSFEHIYRPLLSVSSTRFGLPPPLNRASMSMMSQNKPPGSMPFQNRPPNYMMLQNRGSSVSTPWRDVPPPGMEPQSRPWKPPGPGFPR